MRTNPNRTSPAPTDGLNKKLPNPAKINRNPSPKHATRAIPRATAVGHPSMECFELTAAWVLEPHEASIRRENITGASAGEPPDRRLEEHVEGDLFFFITYFTTCLNASLLKTA